MHMLVNPVPGDKHKLWRTADEAMEGTVYIPQELGKYGLSHGRWQQLQRAFRLPMHPEDSQGPDPFRPIRSFEEEWNKSMASALTPGSLLVVDESMGLWKGHGMPGLLKVPHKPTPIGWESHTTVCVKTGALLFSELYEGKTRMANKEYVGEVGKVAAVALRCTKPWHGTGRTIILDAGFAGLSAAYGLAERGLHMIGTVKRGHKGFLKKWLLDHVHARGIRVNATPTITLTGAMQWSLLAAADRDKQPMALLGTASTSNMAHPIVRRFTVIRGDGTYNVRTAELHQQDMHATYRRSFNGVDKHNSLRQGNHNFEDSWKTHQWWVRDFQMLFGMSEVNAYLFWRHFIPGEADINLYHFRSRLTHPPLHNPIFMRERGDSRMLRARGIEVEAAQIGSDRWGQPTTESMQVVWQKDSVALHMLPGREGDLLSILSAKEGFYMLCQALPRLQAGQSALRGPKKASRCGARPPGS
mmetsp:Transcript_5073/g.14159  ORF Transcript_5073/g.14159 Transcript_5073/m.14159 type:complete len:471 (-) Transcript_5073:163-1575(-)